MVVLNAYHKLYNIGDYRLRSIGSAILLMRESARANAAWNHRQSRHLLGAFKLQQDSLQFLSQCGIVM